jgi:Replication-relaxation
LIYELDARGSHVLRERGLSFLPKSYHRNFAHELMVSQIMASIELGTREKKNVRLITWPEILASSNTPGATRQSATTCSIPVTFTAFGEPCSMTVNADARPFGVERTIEGSCTYLFFPGIEADCGTEPVETSNLDRSSITKKVAAYRAIAEQGLYRSHFGFPNFFVPFITTTRVRMESMMKVVDRMTEGSGSKMFLFKALPAFSTAEKLPKAGGHMLTEPWQRCGFPPFYLDH